MSVMLPLPQSLFTAHSTEVKTMRNSNWKHLFIKCCSFCYSSEVFMNWISDFLDPDYGCVQQDQEFGFPSCSRIRAGFGFCTYWKNVTGCLLCWYSTGFKQESDSLSLVGAGSGVDSDSKFAKQDWIRCQKNQSPHTSATHQRYNRIRITGVDSDRILRFSFGVGFGPRVKNLGKTGSGVIFQFRQ